MKTAILVLSVLFVLCTLAAGQLCPATPEGYVPQYRPIDVPANYPPPEEPGCFQQGTQEAGSYIACLLCHDYMRRQA